MQQFEYLILTRDKAGRWCEQGDEKVLIPRRHPGHRPAVGLNERQIELAKRDALHPVLQNLITVREVTRIFDGICLL